MLTIRLTRKGKKNQPFFRVIVIDKKRTARGGNAVEILGNVDPLTKKRNFKKDRILYWISKGAKPSPSVHNLLVSEKIIDAKKINVSKKPKVLSEAEGPKKSAEVASAAASAPTEVKAEEKPVEAPKEEVKPVEEPVKPAEPKPAEAPKEPAQNPADIKAGEGEKEEPKA